MIIKINELVIRNKRNKYKVCHFNNCSSSEAAHVYRGGCKIHGETPVASVVSASRKTVEVWQWWRIPLIPALGGRGGRISKFEVYKLCLVYRAIPVQSCLLHRELMWRA